MNKLIILIFSLCTIIWAVQPVAKTNRTDEEPVIKIHTNKNSEHEENTKSIKIRNKEPEDSHNDHFIDTDSNNINDQREDDLLKIKQLKIKLKDLFKKDTETQPSKVPSKRK